MIGEGLGWVRTTNEMAQFLRGIFRSWFLLSRHCRTCLSRHCRQWWSLTIWLLGRWHLRDCGCDLAGP